MMCCKWDVYHPRLVFVVCLVVSTVKVMLWTKCTSSNKDKIKSICVKSFLLINRIFFLRKTLRYDEERICYALSLPPFSVLKQKAVSSTFQ